MNDQMNPNDSQTSQAFSGTKASEFFPDQTKTGTEAAAVSPKLTKKRLITFGVIGAAILVVIIAIALLYESEFEKVRKETLQIAGCITGSGDYFMVDTYPDEYKTMDKALASILLPNAEVNALKAIKYANEALGFNGSLYSQMIRTSALMGRQSAENEKYRVSWTYHPDDGLEVTYEKK